MSEEPPQDATRPEVGSVAEEAAQLFAALAGFAREQGGQYAGAAAGAAGAASEALRTVNEHVATGAPECTWCPVCQVIHTVRATSPEVRAHLTAAASSLLQAVAGLMATTPASERGGTPVERIDLDGEEDA